MKQKRDFCQNKMVILIRILKRYVPAFLLLALYLIRASAQNNSHDSPLWMNETPKGYTNDYFVGTGTSTISEADAHKEALASAIQSIIIKRGITVSSSENNTFTRTNIEQKDSVFQETIKKTVIELDVKGHSTTINGLSEEERFYEYDGRFHTVWCLVKIPKETDFITPPNGFSPLWRSILMPGWGQLFKGQRTKGFLILGSEVLLIPSAFIFHNLHLTARTDAENSRTQALRDYYNDQSNLYQDISLGCFIAAGALYLFNVVDATISEGGKIYVYEHNILFGFRSDIIAKSNSLIVSINF
jgi:hypothetical protein